MIPYFIRYRIAQIKYFFNDKLPFILAYYIPRKVALMCFVRVYSVLGSISNDYENAYKMFESGIGK